MSEAALELIKLAKQKRIWISDSPVCDISGWDLLEFDYSLLGDTLGQSTDLLLRTKDVTEIFVTVQTWPQQIVESIMDLMLKVQIPQSGVNLQSFNFCKVRSGNVYPFDNLLNALLDVLKKFQDCNWEFIEEIKIFIIGGNDLSTIPIVLQQGTGVPELHETELLATLWSDDFPTLALYIFSGFYRLDRLLIILILLDSSPLFEVRRGTAAMDSVLSRLWLAVNFHRKTRHYENERIIRYNQGYSKVA